MLALNNTLNDGSCYQILTQPMDKHRLSQFFIIYNVAGVSLFIWLFFLLGKEN